MGIGDWVAVGEGVFPGRVELLPEIVAMPGVRVGGAVLKTGIWVGWGNDSPSAAARKMAPTTMTMEARDVMIPTLRSRIAFMKIRHRRRFGSIHWQQNAEG
jgi:hypothetical protein